MRCTELFWMYLCLVVILILHLSTASFETNSIEKLSDININNRICFAGQAWSSNSDFENLVFLGGRKEETHDCSSHSIMTGLRISECLVSSSSSSSSSNNYNKSLIIQNECASSSSFFFG